jgi:hypothetical protein
MQVESGEATNGLGAWQRGRAVVVGMTTRKFVSGVIIKENQLTSNPSKLDLCRGLRMTKLVTLKVDIGRTYARSV